MDTGAGPASAPPPPGVRTTRRRGRTSAAQRTTLATLGASWLVDTTDIASAEARRATFGRTAPLLIDIGVGDGRASVNWAEQHRDADLVAIELHRPGIVKLLRALEDEDRSNVRVLETDAVAVLDELAPGSVDSIRVLFPDPWPKRRHLHRRLVDRRFVATVADLLQPHGELHLATDWDDYAAHIISMVATDRRLVPEQPSTRPSRPVTAYEQRGLDAGRHITDLCYRRVANGDQPSVG